MKKNIINTHRNINEPYKESIFPIDSLCDGKLLKSQYPPIKEMDKHKENKK